MLTVLKKSIKKWVAWGAVLFFLGGEVFSAHAQSAVASVVDIAGEVDIYRDDRVIPVKKGLILKDEDLIVTQKQSIATILFRDGSNIRLYESTNFEIEKSYEVEGRTRGFRNVVKLNIGSFWGRFSQNKWATTIKTPSAICGVKSASVVLTEKEEGLDISLFDGALEVKNEEEEVLLHSGSFVANIAKQEKFSNRVENIPYYIDIKPETKLSIPKSGTSTIMFTLQLTDAETKGNLERPGRVHISSNIDRVVFPTIQLNARGYARFHATVYPFRKADYDKMQLEIVATMEGKEMMNIKSGKATLQFTTFERDAQRSLQVSAKTGRIFE